MTFGTGLVCGVSFLWAENDNPLAAAVTAKTHVIVQHRNVMIPPETIANPVTGDSLKVLRCSRLTAHESVLFEFALPAGAAGSPMHFHTRIRERFEVLDGQLTLIAGASRQPRVLGPGEALLVEPGTRHRFWNPHDRPVTFLCEVSPSRDFETFMLALYQLAREGLAGPSGMPRNILMVAVLIDLADFHVPGVPVFAQRWLRRMLVSVARWSGAENSIHELAEKLR